MPVLDQPQKNIRALKRLVSRFNQSSLELIQEYRWLEARADYLVERRRETLCYHEEKFRCPWDNINKKARIASASQSEMSVLILAPLTLAL